MFENCRMEIFAIYFLQIPQTKETRQIRAYSRLEQGRGYGGYGPIAIRPHRIANELLFKMHEKKIDLHLQKNAN